MNDVTTTAANPSADQLASLKQLTMITYILYALSAFTGFTGIVAIVMNYVKRDDTAGTLYESHFTWQIRTFWWGLLWGVVGMALVVVLVGFPILFVAWVWMVYRVVKGWLTLNEGKPVFPA